MSLLWLSLAHAAPGPVDAEVAAERAQQAFPGARAVTEQAHRTFGPLNRPVWAVHLGTVPGYDAPVALVDAATGVVVAVEDDVLHAQAAVYPNNPVVDEHPVIVELPAAAATALSDDRLELFQCRDRGELFDGFHRCTEEPAAGPVDGDYLAYAPDPYPARPASSEDDFPAANLYWTLSKGLDWFEDHGWVSNADYDARAEVVANLRITDLFSKETAMDPAAPLLAYNNAFAQSGWRDSQAVWHPPRLVFGQGSRIDYAYDADVIHHELAHLIVSSLGGLSQNYQDKYGLSQRARAMNEGLADYFSSAIQDDPVLGEYSGDARPYIRTLIGDDRCDGDLYGQSHWDGHPFAQGLWSARSTLSPEDRDRMDTAVLASISEVSENPTFEQAFDIVTTKLDATVGSHAGDALRDEWRRRGIDDCRPVVDVPQGTEQGDDPTKGPVLVRNFTQVAQFNRYRFEEKVPGYIQFRVQIPEPGTVVRLSARQNESIDINQNVPPVVQVWGQTTDELIVWDRTEVELNLGSLDEPFWWDVTRWTTNAHSLGEMVRVETEPHRTRPDTVRTHTDEISFVVEERGAFVFQLVNEDTQPGTLLGMTIQLDVPDEAPSTSRAVRAAEQQPLRGCQSTPTVLSGAMLMLLAGFRRR